MKLFKFLAPIGIIISLIACSSQESKIESILDRQIGTERVIEKARLELDSMLGKNDSKLKDSILAFISDGIEVRYTNILIDGKKARVKVVAVVPKMDEVNTLILHAGFLPRETMLNMTFEDVLAEVSKKSRRPASQSFISETYEFSVDFDKNKYWIPNYDQLKNAYAKRNIISKR